MRIHKIRKTWDWRMTRASSRSNAFPTIFEKRPLEMSPLQNRLARTLALVVFSHRHVLSCENCSKEVVFDPWLRLFHSTYTPSCTAAIPGRCDLATVTGTVLPF